MAEVAERVARGATLLDERRPGWWRDAEPGLIDLDRLNIEDCADCVLGQLYPADSPFGSYEHGLRALGITARNEAVAYGFISADGSDEAAWEIENDCLQHEWSCLIAARRDAAKEDG